MTIGVERKLARRGGMINSQATQLRGSSPTPLTEQEILSQLATFDFIDVGSNKGDSYAFASTVLGGLKGLALDVNPRAVDRLRAAGIPALLRDCRTLALPGSRFRFGVLSHVLEHLDSTRDVALVINGIASVVENYLFIRQPFFDEDPYLSTKGLKSVASNLSYHPLHITTETYVDVFRTLDVRDYAIFGSGPLRHSHESGKIVVGTAPMNTKGWKNEPSLRPPRIVFDRPIYRELVVVVRLSSDEDAEGAVSKIPDASLLFKSARRFPPLPG